MTAKQIIEQIGLLSSDQRESVLSFVRELDSTHRISSGELEALTEKFVAATDEEEVSALREEIISGFYGRLGDRNVAKTVEIRDGKNRERNRIKGIEMRELLCF